MLLVTTVVALVVSRLSNWSHRVLAITIRGKVIDGRCKTLLERQYDISQKVVGSNPIEVPDTDLKGLSNLQYSPGQEHSSELGQLLRGAAAATAGRRSGPGSRRASRPAAPAKSTSCRGQSKVGGLE